MTRRKKNPQSSNIWWVMGLPLLLAVVSLGCGLSGAIANLRAEPTFEPTRTPMPTFTATPPGESFLEIATPEPVVEEAPVTEPIEAEADAAVEEPVEAAEDEEAVAVEEAVVAEEEEEVAEEAAPAAGTTVTLTVRQDMNVRTGPGTNYPVAGPGPAGSSAQVLGRNADASWLQVEYPPGSGSKGWLYADLVDVSGDPVAVAVVQAPAAPAAAPAPAPQPQAEAPPPAPPQPQYQFTPGAWHASENAAIVHFKGRIKDEGGNLVNGYSVR
ncbi:MAG: hypothetical protein R3264_12850, partial [Anaerolineae bacterium]|nr:hypothetical protein [Anaerolineae bacterium]